MTGLAQALGRLAVVVGLLLGGLAAAMPGAAAQGSVGAGFEIGTSVLAPTNASRAAAVGLQALGTFEVVFELDPGFHVTFATENLGAPGGAPAPAASVVAASLVRFRFRHPQSRVGVLVGLGSATVQGSSAAVPVAELGLRLRAAFFQREVYASEVGVELGYRFMPVPGTPAVDLSGVRAGVSVGIRF